MRLIRHDVRDLKLAFGLAFDVQRVSRAGYALAWTGAVLFCTLALLAWQLQSPAQYANGLYEAWMIIFEVSWEPSQILLWALMATVWWLGYGYLNGPVYRSTAVDIARDERERNSNIPALCRQVAFAPLLGMLLPGIMFLVVLLWSLISLIPGTPGALATAITVPIPLVAGLIGGAVMLVVLLAAPLMGPTAMVEGRDYFEVLSRPMSYLVQRPGTYFAYGFAKLGMMLFSALVGGAVLAVAWGMVALALAIIGQGEIVTTCWQIITSSPGVPPLDASHAFGLALMFAVSVGILLSWLSVVGLNCDVIIYLLLRYKIDGVTFDTITVAEERIERLPSAEDTAEQAEEARKRFDEQQQETAPEEEAEKSTAAADKPEEVA